MSDGRSLTSEVWTESKCAVGRPPFLRSGASDVKQGPRLCPLTQPWSRNSGFDPDSVH